MLILSTYKRIECPCGWKKDEHGIDIENKSDDENISEELITAALMPIMDSNVPEIKDEDTEHDNKYVKFGFITYTMQWVIHSYQRIPECFFLKCFKLRC